MRNVNHKGDILHAILQKHASFLYCDNCQHNASTDNEIITDSGKVLVRVVLCRKCLEEFKHTIKSFK